MPLERKGVQESRREGLFPYFEEVLKSLEEKKADFRLGRPCFITEDRGEEGLPKKKKYPILYENDRTDLYAEVGEADDFFEIEIECENGLEENGLLELLDGKMRPDVLSYGDGSYRFLYRKSNWP